MHVDLDGVEDAALLAPEAASALGVVAATADELGEQLARATARRPRCSCSTASSASSTTPARSPSCSPRSTNLTVLATSRAPLRLTGEHVYRVQPLAPPNAAALFAARAGAARAGWTLGEDDREIVDADLRAPGRAAAGDRARRRPRPPAAAAGAARAARAPARAADRGRRATCPARQRSLRATLEWSWEVLDERERRLLAPADGVRGRRLARRRDRRSAAATGRSTACSPRCSTRPRCCGPTRASEPRFAMLDTVREFAAERAADDSEVADAELRHARYFLDYSRAPGGGGGARGPARLARAARLRARQPAPRLRAAAARRRSRRGAARRDRVRARRCRGTRTPTRSAAGWPAALAALTEEAPELRATALYWDGRLALSQARFAEAEPRLRGRAGGRARGGRA